jgi:transcriptional regulator with XRE-family HTH domain
MGIVDRIKWLCEVNNISLNKLEKGLGFGKSVIARWDVNSPAVDKVGKVADYFNVTVDYILGRDPAPDKLIFEREPTPEEWEMINNIARLILSQEKKKKEKEKEP